MDNNPLDWKDLNPVVIQAEAMRWYNGSMFAAGAIWAQRRLKEANGWKLKVVEDQYRKRISHHDRRS